VAIAIADLTKRYGHVVSRKKITAVKNLKLEVRKGEIFGFLGLNGAGKTTTIRILLDLIRPTAGAASIFGRNCQSNGLEARSLIGYLPGEMGVYADLTGRRLLDLLAGLGPHAIDPSYRGELQERLELTDKDLNRRLREYSTGMKRKLGLIQAFQTDPPLLILDEPTEGLDPLVQDSFYQLLHDLRERGRTVFMSSHVLSEVERVCERIGVIRQGELVLLSTVEDIRRMAPRRVRVLFSRAAADAPKLPNGHELISATEREWNLRVQGALGPLLALLDGHEVSDIEIQEPKLEDVLIRYYREGRA